MLLYGSDIDGLVDMKLICGITVAEERVRVGKEDKVISFFFFFFFFLYLLLIIIYF